MRFKVGDTISTSLEKNPNTNWLVVKFINDHQIMVIDAVHRKDIGEKFSFTPKSYEDKLLWQLHEREQFNNIIDLYYDTSSR